MTARHKREAPLSSPAKRCLAALLDAELNGGPVEFHTWRAANAKKIPLLEELKRNRAIQGDTHCAVTFWGLMNAPGQRAQAAIANCERVFKALRKHYPKHPKEPISLEDLSKQARLPPIEALQSAHFLSRSPVYLSVHTLEQKTNISPNEQYVTLKGFEEVKERAQKEGTKPLNPVLPLLRGSGTADSSLTQDLESSESEAVRECWHKAVGRFSSDPAGAITAAKSLAEAACKYVLEECGEAVDTSQNLPKLYKRAAGLLQLDQRADVNESMRRGLQACATVVDSLSELRNKLGDAHGKGRHSPKPAKRHAQFIVMVAGAMAGLLLATMDARRTP